ncbi:MAG: preprotein translocase subunit SecA [Leptotrichiaceae bacterium]|jgi:preprotein translocase subunit SecA
MIKTLTKSVFGTTDERTIKKMSKDVKKINSLESEIEKLEDLQLKGKTEEFKMRITNGESLDSVLPEAFAVVREATKRVLGMRHYDVQLIGGMILHSGKISEMKTGEGKTLMSTLPIYLNALTGKGVHVITVNDYLAKRDRDTMSELYDFLGLSSGVVVASISPEERKAAYEADITYGTNNEFGFDYLRDNMVHEMESKVQREHNYAIVDEIDSILIDEARTPLIISGAAEETTHWYNVFSEVVTRLTRSVKTETIKDKKNTVIPAEDWEDYEVDEKAHTVTMTEKGVKNVEKMLKLDNLYSPETVELTHFLSQALKAKELFKRDRDYIVNDKGEVIIVDEFTGRLMEGRRYSDGLHQAIEAKEKLEVAGENQTLATITLQNYFRMYKKLSGMTGTAKTEEEEFKQIYRLPVVIVPTNMPVIRKDFPDVIYMTGRAKYNAIVAKIQELFEKGQPVLVGTASIQHSEELSDLLKRSKIPHELLNAKHHEREAEIIAQAGRYKTVTIATNMAGRGTDIKLGGDPEMLASKVAEKGTDEYKSIIEIYKKDCEENKKAVIAAGGLFILGTERHESRRIDNQLRGRGGRQGDPGASEFYLSLEDDLMRLFGGDRLKMFMNSFKMPEDEEIRSKMITRSVENAQKRVESRNFSIRKNLIEYDDVSNKQREIIYKQRDKVLRNENLKEFIQGMMLETVEDLVDTSLNGESRSQWNFDFLREKLRENYDYTLPENTQDMDKKEIIETINNDLLAIYNNKEKSVDEDTFRKIENYIMLEVLDQRWRENLKDLTELREGIHLRSYAQKNPVSEYKIISADIYNEMIDTIKREVSSFMIKIRINTPEDVDNLEHDEVINLTYEQKDEFSDEEVQTEDEKVMSRKERRESERKK